MSAFPRPIPREQLRLLLADLPEDVFSEEFTQACEALDVFVGDCLRFLVAELHLSGFEGTADELVESRGYSPHGSALLRWLLDCLGLYGLAVDSRRGVAVTTDCQRVDLEAAYVQKAAANPEAEAALAVQKLATLALPAVLAGSLSGEEALFSLEHLDLWFAYFSNANIHYAPTNRLAGIALAQAVAPRARILEVGGGGGSAAQAALQALVDADKPPSLYAFTEVHPAFLRRGARSVRQLLPEGCELRVQTYDINVSPAEQGLLEEAFDAVFAVNVLHLARDLVGTLQQLRRLLVPGGALVLGELIRSDFSTPVHLELPFLLLRSYREAAEKDGIRARPGFLCLEGWRNALQAAGFSQVSVLPAALDRCLALYPGFYCAALVTR